MAIRTSSPQSSPTASGADAASARRRTAEERRHEIIEAATVEFAVGGVHGASTEAIARRAGISQPYLFRLFGTKKELFLAVTERTMSRILDAFRTAVDAAPEAVEAEEPLAVMGNAYVELLRDRELLLCQFQCFAACAEDEDVRAVVRERYADVFRFAEEQSGAPLEDVRRFIYTGMFLNVAVALGLPDVARDGNWAERLLAWEDGKLESLKTR